MSKPNTCKARQYSDQMACACGLAWDMNDPAPPECRSGVVAKQELAAMRVTLSEPARWSIKKQNLLSLAETPLRWLPAYGLRGGLFQIEWVSLPDAAFVLLEMPAGLQAGEQGRDYKFFNKKGNPYMEIKRREGGAGPVFAYRYIDATDTEWSTE